ncbi:BatD family protein [Carboxylicivirga mesophila]|uniref:BatD family protein n=1 Tax=Carboxylicivirga mesophila TaxID=1166478 RepID=A0ABS5KD63_9BACT|nr:BatD family protein [Carboxylicivirga mesophila]MBS2212476.1 BatD family protein [Carboxylicivirga mesophila]
MNGFNKIVVLHIVAQLVLLIPLLGQNVYTRVSVSPRSVYVGQPSRYSVKIYTDTWFTDGAEFAPFNLGDAFVVPAANQVGSERINGKTYSYVEYNYWIYPYNEGELNLPQQKVVVHSPAPGQFKASPQVKITAAKTLNVIGNPPNVDADNWVVAQSMSRKDSWSRPVKTIKVGEVLERTVDIQAYGTMAAFMPSLDWGTAEGISIYPQTANLTTETPDRTSAIIASEKQTVAYLFEKEGVVTIPAVELGYWNVKQHRWIDRSLPAIQIEVLPNEDLSVLASHKEMLGATLEEDETPLVEEQTATSTWMKLLKWMIFLVAAALFIFMFMRMIKWLIRINIKRRQSEAYAYRKLLSSVGSGSTYYMQLYRWINVFSSEKSLEELVKAEGSAALQKNFEDQYSHILGKEQNRETKRAFFKALRKELKQNKAYAAGLNP